MESATEVRGPARAVTPGEEYARRRDARRRTAKERVHLERILGNGRLVVFLVVVGLAWFSLATGKLSLGWVLAPLGLFFLLFVWHERVVRTCRRAVRAASFYERALARLHHDWSGRGQPGTRFLEELHPNAYDLDLFGTGSVFELLCTARTRKGEDTLAAWLLAPAPPVEVRARQAAVEDLRQRLDLREDLAMLGAELPGGIDLERLATWAVAPPILVSRWARRAAFLLGLCGAAALTGMLFFDLTSIPLAVVLVIEAGFFLSLGRRVTQVIRPVDRRAHDLSLFAAILARLESEPFTVPRLVRLQEELNTAGLPPSHRIAQLVRLIELLDSRRNILFAPLAPLLLWGTQMAFAIEAWRAASGAGVPRWLAAVGRCGNSA